LKPAGNRRKGLGGLKQPALGQAQVYPMPIAAEEKCVQAASGPTFVLDPDDELLIEEEAMSLLKIKNKQWLADHRTRILPIIPHILFGREIRYPKRLLLRWIASLIETRPMWERKQREN
jgi:hypothetical protein